MPDSKPVATIQSSLGGIPYGVLEPGLQAAIDLLEREIRNSQVAGELADGRDDTAEAHYHAFYLKAYQKAQELLREQMTRLKPGVGRG